MTIDIGEAFSESSEVYDLERRALVPCFDQFYGHALGCLKLGRNQRLRILDLGAGTGLFAAMVAKIYPNTDFRLIDLSAEMLEKARTRFSGFASSSVEIIVGDYSDIPLDGPYDAIISSLSIHHLSDEKKQELFASIHAALNSSGIFVNAEQVLGETPEKECKYEDWWQRSAIKSGATKNTIERAKTRMKFDQCAPVRPQLEWMRNAGFRDASCVFQDHRFAVLTGSV